MRYYSPLHNHRASSLGLPAYLFSSPSSFSPSSPASSSAASSSASAAARRAASSPLAWDIVNLFDRSGFDLADSGSPSQARSASARGRPAQSPPYNIVKVDEQQYTIEVAVPGYARENIVVEQDGTQLNIRGEPQTADASEGPAALTATPAEESGTAAEESGTVAETGVASPGEATSPYLHRGFGAEQFALSFALNDRAEVTEGEVANGVLRVSISIPPELQPKRVTLT